MKKFCKPFIQKALIIRVIIEDKDTLVKILFSTFIVLYLLLSHSIFLTYCYSTFWRRPYGIDLLLIMLMPPLYILLWLLVLEVKWEKLWRSILKVKNAPIKIFNIFLISLGLLIVFFNLTIFFERKVNSSKIPNIILISINGLRADHLGCYGYERNITSQIDRFSKDSVLFKNFIAQSPSSFSFLYSIFTSLIPSHQDKEERGAGKFGKLMNAIEILKNYNYNIACYSESRKANALVGFGFNKILFKDDINSDEVEFKDIIEGAVDWIKNNRKQRFFIFLNSDKDRFSLTLSREHLIRVDRDYMRRLGDWKDWKDHFNKIRKGEIKHTEDDLKHIINLYDAEIMYLDEELASLFTFLKDNNLYDDSIIIFTSDHGIGLGEHGQIEYRGDKFYDELLKVPLLIKFPNSQYKGKVIQDQVRSIDILPTILDWFGIKKMDCFEGKSLMFLIRGKKMEELYAVSQAKEKYGSKGSRG